MHTAAAAKRKYKVLLREQDRLRERGTTDGEIETELSRLRSEYPELCELTSHLSAGTTSMLAFAETMAAESNQGDVVGGATAVSDCPTLVRAPSHETTRGVDNRCATGADSVGRTAFSGWLAAAFAVLPMMVSFVAPFLQPPRTNRALCLLVVAASIAMPVVYRVHPNIWAPCNNRAEDRREIMMLLLTDPVAFTILAHCVYFLLVARRRGSHAIAYLVRDMLPAVMTSFVLFSSTTMVLNITTNLRPVQSFC
jgi:hypothetical protein